LACYPHAVLTVVIIVGFARACNFERPINKVCLCSSVRACWRKERRKLTHRLLLDKKANQHPTLHGQGFKLRTDTNLPLRIAVERERLEGMKKRETPLFGHIRQERASPTVSRACRIIIINSRSEIDSV